MFSFSNTIWLRYVIEGGLMEIATANAKCLEGVLDKFKRIAYPKEFGGGVLCGDLDSELWSCGESLQSILKHTNPIDTSLVINK